jgi:2-(1,2-epoxy-1,2-dihydrophenyl)acetyl-CoA isomerase
VTERERITYEAQGAVAYITLNRPEKLNAITPAMHDALMAAFRCFESDDEAYIAVLRGAGRGFCAGRDLNAQARTGVSPTAHVDETVTGYGLPAISKFLITAARGPAIGVGGYMMMGGDIRVVSDTLHFALTEVPTAVLGPYWIQQSEMLPPTLAFRLAMGDRLSIEELSRWGLVTEVVADAELEATVQKWVDWLLGLPRQHALATKALMKDQAFKFTPQLFEQEYQVRGRLDALSDTREAAQAFVERRPPRYTGT